MLWICWWPSSTHFFLHKRHKYCLEKLVAEHFIRWQSYRLDDILGPWQEIIASKIMWCNTVYVPISSVIIIFLKFMFQLILKSFEVPYKKQHNFCKTTDFLSVKNTNNQRKKGKGGRKNVCYKNTTERSEFKNLSIFDFNLKKTHVLYISHRTNMISFWKIKIIQLAFFFFLP